MPPADPGLDTADAAALLQQRYALEVERHNEGETAMEHHCCVVAAACHRSVPKSSHRACTHPRTADLHHTEARLQAALKELEIVRGEEARALAQRAAALRREHDAAMQALERRFLADAEALQVSRRVGCAARPVQPGCADLR